MSLFIARSSIKKKTPFLGVLLGNRGRKGREEEEREEREGREEKYFVRGVREGGGERENERFFFF